MDNINIFEYYKTHPDASIKDYLDYVNEYREKEQKEREEKIKNCEEWYKALAGRYFVFDFNGCSFCAVKVDKWPSNEFRNKYDCYNIDARRQGIVFENRDINRYWFNNPYERDYTGRDSTKCKEITKEQFDFIAENANNIKSFVETTINSVVKSIK
jgi:hypothetical protein